MWRPGVAETEHQTGWQIQSVQVSKTAFNPRESQSTWNMKRGSDSAALPAVTETHFIRREMRNRESNYSAEIKWDEVQTEKTGPIAEFKVINCKQRESQKHKETFRFENAGLRKPEEKCMKLKQVWLFKARTLQPPGLRLCLIGHSSYCNSSDDAYCALELTRQWFYSITDLFLSVKTNLLRPGHDYWFQEVIVPHLLSLPLQTVRLWTGI